MADSKIIMPDDTSNTGKKVRTQERSVSGDLVHEHYVILQDETNDYQASISSTGAMKVDGSAVTQPVSGTVTVGQGTAAAVAGGWPVKVTDGTLTASVRDTGGNDSLNVAIVDAVGSHITNFGGGTQYTEGDTDTTITGTAMLWEDTADTLRAVSSTKPLPVGDAGGSLTVDGTVAVTQSGTWDEVGINDSGNKITVDWNGVDPPIGAGTEAAALRVTVATDSTGVLSVDDNGGSLTVDGTVTANAGTNLNTSALNLETTQADIKTSVQLIDDSISTLGTTTYTEATTKGAIVGVVRRDADTSAVNTDNEVAPLLVDANGYLKVEIFDGGGSHTVDGTITANAGTGNFNVIGTKTNDNAAPGATNVGALTAIANASAPSWTEGNLVGLSVNTAGALRVTGGGGGTEYVVNAVVPSDPTGTTLVSERDDQLSTLTEVEGDWTNTRATSKGALWVAIPDVNGDPITSFGGGTQYTEDAAAAANPTGTALNLLRTDTLSATTVDADGDNIAARAASTGAMYVEVTAGTTKLGNSTDGLLVNLGANNDVTVTGSVTANAGTNLNTSALNLEATQASILTSVQLQDDTVATLGTTTYTEATTKGTTIGAVRRDADTSPVNTDNEIGPLTMDANGRLKVEIFDGGDSYTVDGTVTANLGTIAGVATETTLSSLLTSSQLIDDTVYTDDTSTHATGTSKGLLMMAAATPTDASVNANDIGAVGMTTDRKLHVAVMDALPAGTNGIGKLTANSGVDIGDVDVTSVIPGTGATNLGKAEDGLHTSGDVGVMALAVSNEANTARAADGDYIPFATDTEGNTRVVGNRDHDAIDAGEPVKIGAKAVALLSDPTAVASNDRTDLYAMRNGIQFVLGGHPNPIHRQFNITDADGAQTDLNILNATVGATDVCVVTMLTVTCDNANTGDVQCRIGFGATNTPGNDATKVILSHPGIAKGSGIVLGNGGGIVGMGAAGDELRMTCEDPVGGSLDVVVTYFIVSNA